jgi:hypothetical protein
METEPLGPYSPINPRYRTGAGAGCGPTFFSSSFTSGSCAAALDVISTQAKAMVHKILSRRFTGKVTMFIIGNDYTLRLRLGLRPFGHDAKVGRLGC